MRILVTGASSLLATHAIRRLLDHGHEVVTLHRSAAPNERYEAISGDVADTGAVEHAVRGCQAVVHAAARVGVVGTQQQFAQTNITGTAVLLQHAREAGVERFVHVSTPSVAHAGDPIVGAGAEPAEPVAASSFYSWSKAVAERQALAADADGFAVVALRPHLVWGPGDTQLVGRIVERARSGRLAFVGSGLALVDSTYVDNAADALIAAVDRAPDVAGRALVVSNGEPRTMHELVTRIVRAAGLPDPSRRVPTTVARAGGAVVERVWQRLDRDDDPPMTKFVAEQLSTAHWFDQATTRDALGWSPQVSIEEGIARLQEWFESSEGSA